MQDGQKGASIRGSLGQWGTQPTAFTIAMLSTQKVVEGPLLVSGSTDINGSLLNDTIVQKNCFLHVRGNLKGSLTIERGANVVVEGSVDGKVINRGGRLVVNNNRIAEFVTVDGPPEAEAGGVLKINLSAIA